MKRMLLLTTALLVVAGCGESSSVPVVVEEGPGDDVGYVEGTDVIVVGGKTWIVTGTSEDCVMLGDECIDIEDAKGKFCEPGAQADVIVVDGKVVDVICYPPASSGVDVEDITKTADGTTEVPQNQADTVVTFDESTNDVPIEGDLNIAAEKVGIIGNGIDATIIDGNIKIDSNNSRIRGLTVNGNVTLDKNCNNAAVSFCKIKGNLEIHANSVTVLNCQVFGNVEVKGNNAVLVNVGVGGNWKINDAEICQDNYAFADADGDFLVTKDELGESLECAPAE